MNSPEFSYQHYSARRILARRIRIIRTFRGWSQEVLAEIAGLHRTYIGAIEREEGNPCLDNIEKIAQALEVPLRHLLDERLDTLFGNDVDRVEEARAVYGGNLSGSVLAFPTCHRIIERAA